MHRWRKIDDSIHKAYIHHIRRAQHYIYLENQYFIGSSHMWEDHSDAGATHLIPAELVMKIRYVAPSHPAVCVYACVCEGHWDAGAADLVTAEFVMKIRKRVFDTRLVYVVVGVHVLCFSHARRHIT